MDFLKNYLPGPVVDIFLPVAILLGLAYFLIPEAHRKAEADGRLGSRRRQSRAARSSA